MGIITATSVSQLNDTLEEVVALAGERAYYRNLVHSSSFLLLNILFSVMCIPL